MKEYPHLEDNAQVRLLQSVEYDNKAIYYGEWNTETNEKHGRGIQIWSDGSKYIGRGLIQITFKDNYRKIGNLIGVGDLLVKNPELVSNNKEIAIRLNELNIPRKWKSWNSSLLYKFSKLYGIFLLIGGSI